MPIEKVPQPENENEIIREEIKKLRIGIGTTITSKSGTKRVVKSISYEDEYFLVRTHKEDKSFDEEVPFKAFYDAYKGGTIASITHL